MTFKRPAIVGTDSEWVETYSPVGHVVHFTKDRSQARVFMLDYEPSRAWAAETLQVVRSTYNRSNAKIQEVRNGK